MKSEVPLSDLANTVNIHGVANDKLEWVARNLGATFVDPNSWIRDLDFGRDGLHFNKTGARELGDLFSRVCGIDSESRKVLNN